MIRKIALSLGAIALLSSSVMAEDKAFSDYAVAAKVGTLGVGIEMTTNVTDNINLRVGVNGYNYDRNGEESGIEYEADLKLLTFDVLADYHPFETSSFRLTAGAMYNKNKLEMNGRPTSGTSFEINGQTYTTAEVADVDATVDFNNFAPYLGIGWGNAVKSAGWGFTADLGVMFQGTPKSTITVDTTGTTLTATEQALLATRVAAEKAELDDTLSSFKYYPVVSVGISYRF